jgi:hypothetical protein
MYNISELSPLNSQQKGFYGKAKVSNNGKELKLFSYDTLVCSVDLTKNKVTYNAYGVHSATTDRHIKAFLCRLGFIPETAKKKEIICLK